MFSANSSRRGTSDLLPAVVIALTCLSGYPISQASETSAAKSTTKKDAPRYPWTPELLRLETEKAPRPKIKRKSPIYELPSPLNTHDEMLEIPQRDFEIFQKTLEKLRKQCADFIGENAKQTASKEIASKNPRVPQTVDIQRLAEDVLRAPDLMRAKKAFNVLFQNAGVAGLKELMLSAHDTIALQAAWQEVCLTIPEKAGARRLHPDAAKLRWFLGFLEGRARVRIPAWWQEGLLASLIYSRDNCLNFAFGDEPFDHDAGFGTIQAPLDTTVKKEAGSIVVSVGKESARISPALLEPMGNLCAAITSSRCYVAVHNRDGGSYLLMSIARDSGTRVWKTAGWGNADPWVRRVGGRGFQRLTVTEFGGRVIVFGASSTGAYVEAFDARDGRNLFRFTSDTEYGSPPPNSERARKSVEEMRKEYADFVAERVKLARARVLSGERLNSVLKNRATDAMELSEDSLKHLNVTRNGASLGPLRKGGRLIWPPVLLSMVPEQERAKLENLTRSLLRGAATGAPERDLQSLQDALVSIGDKLFKKWKDDEIPTDEYRQAKRFVGHLSSARASFTDGSALAQLKFQEWAAGGKTVRQLLDYMIAHQLRFAPAVEGDEDAYLTLYRHLLAGSQRD